jgi:hypothetical protein
VTAREEIAAAASTVPGIKVTPYAEGKDADGNGYVQIARDEFPNKFGGETYWEVVILCPTDTVQAQKFYESKRLKVVQALRESRALVVTRVAPDYVTTGETIRKAFVVEGHRETEE